MHTAQDTMRSCVQLHLVGCVLGEAIHRVGGKAVFCMWLAVGHWQYPTCVGSQGRHAAP